MLCHGIAFQQTSKPPPLRCHPRALSPHSIERGNPRRYTHRPPPPLRCQSLSFTAIHSCSAAFSFFSFIFSLFCFDFSFISYSLNSLSLILPTLLPSPSPQFVLGIRLRTYTQNILSLLGLTGVTRQPTRTPSVPLSRACDPSRAVQALSARRPTLDSSCNLALQKLAPREREPEKEPEGERGSEIGVFGIWFLTARPWFPVVPSFLPLCLRSRPTNCAAYITTTTATLPVRQTHRRYHVEEDSLRSGPRPN